MQVEVNREQNNREEQQRFEDLRVIHLKASLKPVEHQSTFELGSLFLNYFGEANDPRRFSLEESVRHLGDAHMPYRVRTSSELGSILYAFGKSLTFTPHWDASS